MIDELRVSKTANFYRLKRPLSNNAIDEMFRVIRASQPSASQNLLLHRRTQAKGVRWSALSFSYDKPPSFFAEGTGIQDRVCGFIFLVEYRDHVAVLKSKLDIPAAFATRNFGKVSAEGVDRAIAHQEAVFEKIRLRNMSISKDVMRNKTFEAPDLRSVVGPAGASRYIPQSYAVRREDDHYSATPSTGRIAQRSERVDYVSLIDFVKAVVDEIVDSVATPAEFIRTFARAVDLASIDGVAQPTIFAVDVASLSERIFDLTEVRLVREVQDNGRFEQLSNAEVEALLQELGTAFSIVPNAGKIWDIVERIGNDNVGKISINRSRIRLRDFERPLSVGISVESTDFLIGEDPNRASFAKYLDAEDFFIVLFDPISFAYINGVLFRDEALKDGGAVLLRYLRTDQLLRGVVDEKGTFTPQHREFDANSTFGVVTSSVSDGDEVLVCDDLGNEWADFIGLSNSSSPPRITFYHAKHGGLSVGASPFHVSVSQAIKNLRLMGLPADAIPAKIRGWLEDYRNDGVQTSIPRVVRGNQQNLAAQFERASNAPDALRRVCIVTSSLSRAAVQKELDKIAAGRAPNPHFVQLYWLLLSFFSACSEMNAHGFVVCQE